MAGESVTPAENRTWNDVRSTVINQLFDMCALARAGRALAGETLDEEKHYMGRILGKIDDLARQLVRQLDDAELTIARKGDAA